jgi:parallel beta-helix repeat protein
MTISNNYVHDHTQGYNSIGIILGSCDSILVHRNLVIRNEYVGIAVGATSNTEIINNTIGKTLSYEGILVDEIPSEDLNIINNIIFENGGNGIEYRYNVTGKGIIQYNLFWNNDLTPICVDCTLDSTNITDKEPLFENSPADIYQLLQNSPAIDAGDPGSPLDPDGTRSDIGAYYHAQTPPGPKPVLIPPQSPTLNRRPELMWYTVEDTSTYLVQVDTLPSFGSPIISIVVSDTTLTPLADLPMQSVYWRIGAGNPVVYSDIDTVIILNPQIPVLIPCTPDPTLERKPMLTWYSVGGASEYHIVIADNSGFTSPQVSISVSDTTFTPLSDLPLGEIYWKVKSDLNGEYSAADNFYIQPDTIPYLYSFNGAVIKEPRPDFQWQPASSATIYKIQIDTTPAFSSPVVSIDVSDTSFTPLSDLDNNMYYWRVSCDLDFSAYSQIDSLEIDTNISLTENTGPYQGRALSVYPSPFKSTVTIGVPASAGIAAVNIYSIDGRNIASFTGVRNSRIQWNAAGQPSGLYLVRACIGHRIFSKRIYLLK